MLMMQIVFSDEGFKLAFSQKVHGNLSMQVCGSDYMKLFLLDTRQMSFEVEYQSYALFFFIRKIFIRK